MEQKHILIVDDVTTNLKCAGEVLRDTYKLSMVKSGKQALQFLKQERPDLILLDINMPDMNGYQIMNSIKTNPVYADIPVVFLTADSDSESEIRGFELGAMDYIRKPYEPEVMLSRLEKILQTEEMKKSLRVSACKDSLTGLWNRRYLEQHIDMLCGEQTSGALLMFDMDNFKKINDSYGHIMGDDVLVKFAEVLKGYARPSDIVSRLGGDEFAIFMQGETEFAYFEKRAEELLYEIEEQVNIVKGHGEKVSVSVGIAMTPQDGTDFLTLYNKADKALYYVKQNGKKGFHRYQDAEQYSFVEDGAGDGKTNVDLQQIREMFEENGKRQGAFHIEYEGFKRIYQFVERCVERSDRAVQLVLFTLEKKEEDMADLEDGMTHLYNAIAGALRKGDVATRFGNTQYVAILMDSTTENGKKAAIRVLEGCGEFCGNHGFSLKYDVQTIKKHADTDSEK